MKVRRFICRFEFWILVLFLLLLLWQSSQKPPPTCLPGSTYADIRGRIFVCVTVNTWQYDDSKK
jgi:hypothetical protein